ncbi:1-phosphatidylinositol 4,5-bisphosphate phosphodiesterase beta egl-8-like [Sycon ciliatum]|uniref:1-phosphatidylinositol 4,5-bisphosphate phosphodiesterase beta egl-8-like n=1 Tax=Sycon ciliatum TaxID=27933 RepID=UPI0020AB6EFA|eukprot:scpid21247/ scgid9696/ 1-phosphatidylinositol 4,5-bisphosphate phosphodiesterase beta-1; PLC-154; Phosphoinositide phospholipase C-beta-1; Phospholipase C-I; Phospholipase C-beta-1
MANAYGPNAGRAAERRRPSERLRGGIQVVKWESVTDDGAPIQPSNLLADEEGFYLYYEESCELIEVHKIADVRIGVLPSGNPKDNVRVEGNVKSMSPTEPHIPLEERIVCLSLVTNRQRLSTADLQDIYLILYSREDARTLQKDILHLSCDPLHASPSVLTLLRKNYSYLMLSHANKSEISVRDLASLFCEGQDEKVLFSLEALKLKPKNGTSGVKKADLPFDQFYALYSHLCTRVEMVDVMRSVARGKVQDMCLSGDNFYDLLTDEKFHYDPRRNFILFPKQSRAETDALMRKHAIGKQKKQNKMSVDSLTHFLLSDDNLVVESTWYQQTDDMNQPLGHYFINSSHNTYLSGHQLKSISSPQMYRLALLAGCRCLELDCWPGENESGEPEPYITHGMTMCTKTPYRDCIQAIAETAFIASDYPVILSFENHCTTNILQEKMARYCREIFGDLLLADPLSGYALEKGTQLPPPSLLKRKILIKNKKRTAPPPEAKKQALVETEQQSTEAVDDDEDGEAKKEDDGNADATTDDPDASVQDMSTGAAVKDVAVVNMELSAIVNYVQPVQFKSFYEGMERGMNFEMSSFSEDRGLGLVRDNPVEFVQYNINQMCRIYPRGKRVESSNYQPQAFWNCGAQMVALNYQTTDSPMQLNIGRFALNGNCGYLLKPKCFTTASMRFDPFGSVHNGIIPHELSLEIISGQYVCKRKCAVSVEVDIIGVPPDVCLRKLKTKPCRDNNVINPRWEHEIIKKRRIIVPEMATIRLATVDDRGMLLGVRFLPVHLIQPGYRHIPLLNRLGKPAGLASLFVHIHVHDFVSEAHAMWVDALVDPLTFLDKQRQDALNDLNATDEQPDDPSIIIDSESRPRSPPSLGTTGTGPPSPGLTRFKAIGHAAMLHAAVKSSSNRGSQGPITDDTTGLTLPRTRSNHDTGQSAAAGPARPPLPTVQVEMIRSHRDYVKFQRKQTKESQDVDKKHRQELVSKQKHKDDSLLQLAKKLDRKTTSLLAAKEKALKKTKTDPQFTSAHYDDEIAKLRKANEAEVQQYTSAFANTQAELQLKHKAEQNKVRKRFAMEEERVMIKVMKQIQATHRTERKALYERELKEARESMVSSADPAAAAGGEGGDRGWQRRVTVAAVVSRIQTLGREHEEDMKTLEDQQTQELEQLSVDQKQAYDALCNEEAGRPRRSHAASITGDDYMRSRSLDIRRSSTPTVVYEPVPCAASDEGLVGVLEGNSGDGESDSAQFGDDKDVFSGKRSFV